jgi:formylglycine-generating enzyme required for sulfatase activity
MHVHDWLAHVGAVLLFSAMVIGGGCGGGNDGRGVKLGPAKMMTLDLGGGVSMEFVLIPAGEFMMGSRDSVAEVKRKAKWESDWYKHEHPQHRVRITRPFYLAKYEVTQVQYERIIGENPSGSKGPNLPVEQVSWVNAVAFCRKLSERSGRTVRLPTEAEWEYACRAGTTTPFHFGETITSDQVNYNAKYAYAGYREKTTNVGSFPANAWGLHDMHGNVYEWCEDWYDESYYAVSPEEDPIGSTEDSRHALGYRVLRGGSWSDSADYCRSAHRGCYGPAGSSRDYGFRVAVAAAGP